MIRMCIRIACAARLCDNSDFRSDLVTTQVFLERERLLAHADVLDRQRLALVKTFLPPGEKGRSAVFTIEGPCRADLSLAVGNMA